MIPKMHVSEKQLSGSTISVTKHSVTQNVNTSVENATYNRQVILSNSGTVDQNVTMTLKFAYTNQTTRPYPAN